MKRTKMVLTLATAGVMAVTLADPASARTIHTKTASATSKKPPSGIMCREVLVKKSYVAKACFAPKGDRLWVRDNKSDGLAAEIRGEVNSKGRPGFHCKYGAKAHNGWRVCNFAKKMPDGKRFAWYATVTKAGKVKYTSNLALSNT
ncbi:hypothetical protein [Streptomyces apocyni]|uniref:hypothetical protein n=1 Tax=Streptomyces apocyni TaxID=2654677 RepID=UPI0012EAC3E1|nr:hypothetical protein [Streptomyces apocyni]